MLARVERTTDLVLAAGAIAFTDLAANKNPLAGMQLKFWVEEPEMLVDLSAKITFSDATGALLTAFTIYVDGVDIANGSNGLAAFTPTIAYVYTLSFGRVVRLAKGEHTAELRAKTLGGSATTINGGTVPCELVVVRHSHVGTLGHGVESKTQLIQ